MTKEAERSTTEPDSSHDAILRSLRTKSKDEIIEIFLQHLKETHNATDRSVHELLSKEEVLLPSAIFANDKLSSLETIVKYLKENKQFTLHHIATVLNRDDRSIWTTYNHASHKMKDALVSGPSTFFVPAQIFASRKLSVLETLSSYLKDVVGMSLHDIAIALHRDDRTIWTVCHRAQKKGGGV